MNETDMPFLGETVRFGYRQTRIGLAAIALGARGVVAILLGSDRGSLYRRLVEALPGAILVEDETEIAAQLDAVQSAVDRPGSTLDYALDMRGTPAELAVWNALCEIPAGETRSYGATWRTRRWMKASWWFRAPGRSAVSQPASSSLSSR